MDGASCCFGFGLDAPDEAAFDSAASARGIPLKRAVVTTPNASELYGRRLVIVRPDGHVAWRANELPECPDKLNDTVGGAAA